MMNMLNKVQRSRLCSKAVQKYHFKISTKGMEALEQLTVFSEQLTVISVSGNREQLKIRNEKFK